MSDNNGPNDLPDTEKEKTILDNQIDALLTKLQSTPLIVNRLDYYGNSIPLGAFCFAIPFILFGFYESGVLDKPDSFTFAIILLFGGVGQITAGVFEYIKSRTFPTIVYLVYGLFFVSFFLSYYYNTDVFEKVDCKKIFYGTWAGLSFPLVIGSLQTNVIYLLQNLVVFGFFIVTFIFITCIRYNLYSLIISITINILSIIVLSIIKLYF